MSGDEDNKDEGLKGDPRRSASATVRVFFYQFWQTVEAWIDLDPEELLFVEGAEDFDLIGSDEATAVQVKDNKASGSLTLGSANALTALGNFWTARKDNTGRKVQFKFITTAEAGSEKDGFKREKGIEVWNLCRQSPLSTCAEDVERIRDFLLKKTSLDRDLAKFLKSASVEDIWQKLIGPVEWLSNQPTLDDVNEIVVGWLLKIGERQGLTATDADRLAKNLCMIVVKAACTKSSSPLTYISFREQLDSAVNVEVPREILRQQEVYEGVLGKIIKAGIETGDAELPTVTGAVDAFTTPVLGTNIWARRNLIDRFRSALDSGVAYVDGSAGMGKTTLVRQALDGEKQLFWTNFRDRHAREIVDVCRALVQEIINKHTNPVVVLDDLNPEDDPRNLENGLGRLAEAIRDHEGSLIIISYKPAGPRLASVLGLSKDSRINVSPFEEEEVRGFLIAEGCPKQRAKELGRIVWLHTSGHPQLVAARINGLRIAAFPKPAFDDIIDQPKEIRDAQAEALNVVRSVLPEGARNLLYRLSLSIPSLKRSHALRIGGANPAIPQVGEMFEHLVGPWLEQPRQDRFRVSALVSRAGQKLLTPEEIKRVHADITTALLAEGTIEVDEFAGIVLHALSGEAEFQLAIAAKVFLTAPKEIKEVLAKELSWVTALGVDPSTRLPISNKAARQFFQLFQWEVAGIATPDRLDQLAKVMEGDFTGDSDELVEALPRILYLSKLLFEVDFQISIDKVVAHMLELWRLVEWANSQDVGIGFGDEAPPMYPGQKRSKFADMFTAVLVPRVRTVGDLRSLVSSLDALDEEDRQRLLDGFKVDDGELRILFSGPWLSIKRDVTLGYEDYAEALEESLSAGQRWKHHPWTRAAARALSAILDEMLDRREDAEKIVTETAKAIGSSLNLDEQLAVIAFNHKEYDKALGIWQRVLPNWKSDKTVHDTQPLFGMRCAAIAAANLEKWDTAAELFGQTIKRAANFSMRPWKIGLLGDQGYALWKNGNRKRALVVFSEAVEALEKLPNKPESFSEYAVQKLVGHTLVSLASQDGSFATPIPGMCSNLAPDERIKKLPPTPTVYTWLQLSILAKEVGDKKLAALCVEKFKNAPFALLRMMFVRDALENRLKSRSLKGVVKLATTMSLEMEKAIQRKDAPPHEPDPPELTVQLNEKTLNAFIRPALWAGILRARVLGRNITKLVKNWQSEIDATQPYLASELALCHTFSCMAVGELEMILKNNQEAFERRFLASVLMIGRDDNGPPGTLYAEGFIIGNAKNYEFLWGVAGKNFSALARKDWQRFSEKRFLLRNPDLHVDAIREACELKKQGWSAAANIILTAIPTVNLNFPEDLREYLQELSVKVISPATEG
ncbi:MAG: hypothetical protein HQ512_12490 [Rhodospirillales bacterium]|nr:hypothetical protein [Rhodospirillales bacterium]